MFWLEKPFFNKTSAVVANPLKQVPLKHPKPQKKKKRLNFFGFQRFYFSKQLFQNFLLTLFSNQINISLGLIHIG